MVDKVVEFCREAGAELLRIYERHGAVTYKDDGSPLTAADRASHELLVKALEGLKPTIPVVSEESIEENPRPNNMKRFWLVDPLDGTKEFLKRSGDFTVNVALVHEGAPVLGVVYVPVRRLVY